MNDPHVVALFYNVHADNVDYSKAPPLVHIEDAFEVRIEERRAEVRIKEHHSSVQSAQAAVEPFLRAWELGAALRLGPGELEFKYDKAEVIDRNPVKGVLHAEAGMFVDVFMDAKLTVGRMSYPDPPLDIARDVNVDLMFDRFCRYRQGKETLAGAANFCLTVLEIEQRRPEAAKRYGFAKTVLDRLAVLAASKGGKDARKAKAAHDEFTPAERQWLEEVMKRIILRVAEVVRDDSKIMPQITMADFPAI
jgi:hypothetical protein